MDVRSCPVNECVEIQLESLQVPPGGGHRDIGSQRSAGRTYAERVPVSGRLLAGPRHRRAVNRWPALNASQDLRRDAVQLRELSDQFRVQSQSVASADLGNRLEARPFREAIYLLEEVFKTCRAEELNDYCLDVGRVPYCVHDAAWLKEEPALFNHHVMVAYTTADASSEYEGEFVFVSV
jgi:hypothetical protein